MLPSPTERLIFIEMTDADLDDLAALWGDPEVMGFYPAPKTRAASVAWLDRNRRSYAEHGHGLWVLRTHDGTFVGDCGLTWQQVNGVQRLEVGYHVRTALQVHGYATEAAAACVDFAREVLRSAELVSISHPDNVASQRVAAKVGLRRIEDDRGSATGVRTVFATTFGDAEH